MVKNPNDLVLIINSKKQVLISNKYSLPKIKDINNSEIKDKLKLKELKLIDNKEFPKVLINILEIDNFELEGHFFIPIDEISKLSKFEQDIVRAYFFYEKNITIYHKQDISITVDIVILSIIDNQLKILLSKRLKKPFINQYVLPGGFIDKNKSVEESAKEILKRDTNIENIYLEQLYTFGDVDRDPRNRVITISYFALVDKSKLDINYSEKYCGFNWFSKSDLNKIKIAFDHRKIINLAFERIRNKIEYTNIAFQLLPEKFTFSQLQEVYEIILEKELDRRNFRKKIMELNILEELNETVQIGRMRPAKLFKFKKEE